MISYSIVVFCALLATCKLTSVASAESCLAAAVAGDFHIKRAGLDNARLDLKTDRTGYQWLAFAAFGDSWWRKGCLSDYPAQIEAEVKAIYGGSPVCRKSGYPADLWWAQYIPGGRASSTHTVVWDSNILKESIRSVIRQCRAKDPGLEMLIMTPVFGEEGSLEPFGIWNVGWNYDPDKAQHPFRRQLRDMCAEERVAFFDIDAPWRQHILDSGKDVGYYHRDRIHSNARGQVILGKLIEKWFSR